MTLNKKYVWFFYTYTFEFKTHFNLYCQHENYFNLLFVTCNGNKCFCFVRFFIR